MGRLFSKLVQVFLLLLISKAAVATVIEIEASNRGSYNSDGVTVTGGSGTSTGNYATSDSYKSFFPSTGFRSFFNFDLTGLSGVVATSVDFYIENGQVVKIENGPTFDVVDFGGDIDLLITNSGGTTAYDDLGTGTVYASESDVTQSAFNLSLNTVGIDAFNSSIGGNFAFGGRYNASVLNSAIFGATGSGFVTKLVVNYAQAVPESSSIALLCFGLAGLGFSRKKKSEKNKLPIYGLCPIDSEDRVRK